MITSRDDYDEEEEEYYYYDDYGEEDQYDYAEYRSPLLKQFSPKMFCGWGCCVSVKNIYGGSIGGSLAGSCVIKAAVCV